LVYMGTAEPNNPVDDDTDCDVQKQPAAIKKQKSSVRESVVIVKPASLHLSPKIFDLSSSSSSSSDEEEGKEDSLAVTIIRDLSSPSSSNKWGEVLFVKRDGSKDRGDSVRAVAAASDRDICAIDVAEDIDHGGLVDHGNIEPSYPRSATLCNPIDDVLDVRKKFLMGDTGKAISMEFRELDARSRLEKRLQKMRDKGTGSDVFRQRRRSDKMRELTKRVQTHGARHRMSLSHAKNQAREKLDKRLKELAKRHEEEKNEGAKSEFSDTHVG
jgi:hypothetical protein